MAPAGAAAAELQHFVLRAQTVALYREALQIGRRTPPELRTEILDEIKREFRVHSKVLDKSTHSYLLARGRQRLVDLQQMLALAYRN